MDCGTDTQIKYRTYGTSGIAGAHLCFILKSNPLSPYPVHPASTIVPVWFWDALNTCSFSVLSSTLHFWSTGLLRALPVQWAISVAFWTAFFWAVSLESQTSKKLLPEARASTPQQRQSGVYCTYTNRIPCKKRELHLQLCTCSA